jgi:hypothetical protein
MGLAGRDLLADHWYPPPGWSATSRYLAWHLLPGNAPALHAAVAGYHRVLAGLDVALSEPVSRCWIPAASWRWEE